MRHAHGAPGRGEGEEDGDVGEVVAGPRGSWRLKWRVRMWAGGGRDGAGQREGGRRWAGTSEGECGGKFFPFCFSNLFWIFVV